MVCTFTIFKFIIIIFVALIPIEFWYVLFICMFLILYVHVPPKDARLENYMILVCSFYWFLRFNYVPCFVFPPILLFLFLYKHWITQILDFMAFDFFIYSQCFSLLLHSPLVFIPIEPIVERRNSGRIACEALEEMVGEWLCQNAGATPQVLCCY